MAKPGQQVESGRPAKKKIIPQPSPGQRSSAHLFRLSAILSLAYFVYLLVRPSLLDKDEGYEAFVNEVGECAQVSALVPQQTSKVWEDLKAQMASEGFKERAVEWLGGAVRIPTESFDNMGEVGEDPRWDIFNEFHLYLETAFPRVHSSLKLTKVNTFGLFYEWKGSDASLKPILLAAHQDVVPVENATVNGWTHPAYSGYYGGEHIWGRGSSDDKSGLIGALSAVETLLEKGFRPTRSVVLAFGFDEEASGFHGAGHLAGAIKAAYGKNGIALILDEGAGFYNQFGSIIALPGVAEKGLYNVRLEVKAPGGHSSVPPPHTSIGILSALLVHLERNPFEAQLDRRQPIYATLQCVAMHAKGVPQKLRRLLRLSLRSNLALRLLQRQVVKMPLFKSLVGTTQAIDLVQGGIKNNALPESAWAVVNHRISVTSSVIEVQQRYTKLLNPLSRKFNMTYEAFGSRVSEEGFSSRRSLILSNATLHGLEPAPITPFGRGAAPYRLLSGTIKATFNAHRGLEGADEITVAPSMMTGNTDTRYYWDLTEHIFRYNHHYGGSTLDPSAGGIHTVNEFIEADTFVEMILFFIAFILNADESTDL